MEEVDPAFIQPIEHRPKSKNSKPNELSEIPVINFSVSSPDDLSGLLSNVRSACQNWGFFQVTNHGVSQELRARIQRAAKEFFYQSMEEKRKVKRDAENAMGYHESEHTKNVRDWKEIFDFLVNDPTLTPASADPDDKELRIMTNQWPQYPPQFRDVCLEYAQEMKKLAYKLLELISMSLGLPADRFNGFFKDQTSVLRLNYYPPCPFPDLALGVGRHKDAGALSVLLQGDVAGLQVKRKSDGEWIPVKPTPDAFIINVADAMQVWSNGMYESVEHRVAVNSEKERFSIPFFLFPSHYVMVKPLEELVNEGNPAKYKEYNWGKYFAARNLSDYKKQDVENVQIDHFKVSV